jgi:hypothetical protein
MGLCLPSYPLAGVHVLAADVERGQSLKVERLYFEEYFAFSALTSHFSEILTSSCQFLNSCWPQWVVALGLSVALRVPGCPVGQRIVMGCFNYCNQGFSCWWDGQLHLPKTLAS